MRRMRGIIERSLPKRNFVWGGRSGRVASGCIHCTRGNVTSAGWQVTLRDPVLHVSCRSGVATLRTAIHLLVTHLLTRDD